MSKLAIIGGSGHGRVIADIAMDCGWQQIAFFDDAWPNLKQNADWPVMGATQDFFENPNSYQGVIVAIGNNAVRLSLVNELLTKKLPLISLCHPTAYISRNVSVGIGSVIMPQVAVNIGSKIGKGCILNTSCSVDHDCIIADGVHLSPGAHLAGGVEVGEATWIGIGASVKQYLSIGSNSTIGAGATVIHHLSSNVTAIGTPAKQHR